MNQNLRGGRVGVWSVASLGEMKAGPGWEGREQLCRAAARGPCPAGLWVSALGPISALPMEGR